MKRLCPGKDYPVGKYMSVFCPRGRTDCESLAQIIGSEKFRKNGLPRDFICCGKHDGKVLIRSHKRHHGDEFRVCWKTAFGVDEMGEWDRRDIIDTIAVLTNAMSIAENQMINEEKP